MKKEYVYWGVIFLLILLLAFSAIYFSHIRWNSEQVPTLYVESNLSASDMINNIDRHLYLFEILLTAIVSLFAILVPVITIYNFNKVEREIKEKIDEIQSIATEEKMRSIITTIIEDERFVSGLFEKIMDERYNKKIFDYTIAYNQKILGLTKFKLQAFNSLFRELSGSLLKSIKTPQNYPQQYGLVMKEGVRESLELFATDWLVLNRLYSGDLEQIKQGLGDYISSSSQNKSFLSILEDMEEQYSSYPDLYPLIVKALAIARA